VTVGDTVVLVQAAAALLLVVQLVRCGGWVLLVLQGLLVVVEGERKMWVDHNIYALVHGVVEQAVVEVASGQDHWVNDTQCALPVHTVLVYLHLAWLVFTVYSLN
jgi:hypothetical protein